MKKRNLLACSLALGIIAFSSVVAVGRGNKIGFIRAYGDRQTEPTVEKCTTDTIYDLASVTKVTATAISVAMSFADFSIMP